MKILHVAPMNVAGVPYNMMDMQRRFGHGSRLVTLHANDLTFPEDICLHLPLFRDPVTQHWRRFKAAHTSAHPPVLRARNMVERAVFYLDDRFRIGRVQSCIDKYGLDEFEIIHYDGGLDFFRDARVARRWKASGKKIVCHYMGSDLRLRGIHPAMDEISDLNLTNESDHLNLHPDIHYLYIPFDASLFSVRTIESSPLRIVHSPSKRSMKGTELILPVIEQLKKSRNVEFVLVEDTPHEEVLRIKLHCDIAIEQVGNMGGTGYGRNSLENLAMGIPTVTEMTDDYLSWLPENPFILADASTLLDRLIHLIDDEDLRQRTRIRGRTWIEKYHSYEAVNSQLMNLYKSHGII